MDHSEAYTYMSIVDNHPHSPSDKTIIVVQICPEPNYFYIFYGQWIYGFLIFFYPGGSATLRSECMPWHVVFGLLVYILAVANASLGFLEKLTFLESSGVAKFGSEAFLVNFTALITILFGVFVVISVLSEAPAPIEDDHSYSSI